MGIMSILGDRDFWIAAALLFALLTGLAYVGITPASTAARITRNGS